MSNTYDFIKHYTLPVEVVTHGVIHGVLINTFINDYSLIITIPKSFYGIFSKPHVSPITLLSENRTAVDKAPVINIPPANRLNYFEVFEQLADKFDHKTIMHFESVKGDAQDLKDFLNLLNQYLMNNISTLSMDNKHAITFANTLHLKNVIAYTNYSPTYTEKLPKDELLDFQNGHFAISCFDSEWLLIEHEPNDEINYMSQEYIDNVNNYVTKYPVTGSLRDFATYSTYIKQYENLTLSENFNYVGNSHFFHDQVQLIKHLNKVSPKGTIADIAFNYSKHAPTLEILVDNLDDLDFNGLMVVMAQMSYHSETDESTKALIARAHLFDYNDIIRNYNSLFNNDYSQNQDTAFKHGSGALTEQGQEYYAEINNLLFSNDYDHKQNTAFKHESGAFTEQEQEYYAEIIRDIYSSDNSEALRSALLILLQHNVNPQLITEFFQYAEELEPVMKNFRSYYDKVFEVITVIVNNKNNDIPLDLLLNTYGV